MKACTKNLLSSIIGCQDTSELTAKKAILGWTDKREKNQFFWIIKKLLKIQRKVANTKWRQCDNLVLYQFVASQLTSSLIYQKVDSTWTRRWKKLTAIFHICKFYPFFVTWQPKMLKSRFFEKADMITVSAYFDNILRITSQIKYFFDKYEKIAVNFCCGLLLSTFLLINNQARWKAENW